MTRTGRPRENKTEKPPSKRGESVLTFRIDKALKKSLLKVCDAIKEKTGIGRTRLYKIAIQEYVDKHENNPI